MGMYTELLLKANLKEDLPKEVLKVLHYLFDGNQESNYSTIKDDWIAIRDKYPNQQFFSHETIAQEFWKPNIDHNFFRCPWWRDIANCCSFYHMPKNFKCIENDRYIFTRCDLKNYHGEIEEFLEWIKPYLDHAEGDCIGWYWYEEDKSPTLLYI